MGTCHRWEPLSVQKKAGRYVNTLMEHLGNALLNKIGRPPETLDKQHTLPNYLVANNYQDPTKCIGEHSDDDPLFAAQTDKTTIFSFNTSGDTIFVVKLKPGQNQFADFLGITRAAKKSGEWLLVFFAPENSVFVMGDYFQVDISLHGFAQRYR